MGPRVLTSSTSFMAKPSKFDQISIGYRSISLGMQKREKKKKNIKKTPSRKGQPEKPRLSMIPQHSCSSISSLSFHACPHAWQRLGRSMPTFSMPLPGQFLELRAASQCSLHPWLASWPRPTASPCRAQLSCKYAYAAAALVCCSSRVQVVQMGLESRVQRLQMFL